MIRFHCPSCQAILSAKESNRSYRCPRCGAQAVVSTGRRSRLTSFLVALAIIFIPTAIILFAAFYWHDAVNEAVSGTPAADGKANAPPPPSLAKSANMRAAAPITFYRIGRPNQHWTYCIGEPRVWEKCFVSYIDCETGTQINRPLYAWEAVENVPTQFTGELADQVQKNDIRARPLEPLRFYVIEVYGTAYSLSKPVIEELKSGPVVHYTDLSGKAATDRPMSRVTFRAATAQDLDMPTGIYDRIITLSGRWTATSGPRPRRPSAQKAQWIKDHPGQKVPPPYSDYK